MNEATVKAALSKDWHSQAAYTGRIKQTETVTIISDDGTSFEKEVSIYISWDSIGQLLELIRKRADI